MKHNDKYQTPLHTLMLSVLCEVPGDLLLISVEVLNAVKICVPYCFDSSVVISDKLKTVLSRSLDPNEKDKHPILPGALCQY